MTDLKNNPALTPGRQSDQQSLELTFEEMIVMIPPAIKDHLLSNETAAIRSEIYKASGLTPEERELALLEEVDVFFGQVPVKEFPDMLYAILGWGEEREADAALLSVRIMGRIMLPAATYLGDVAGAIRDIGFNPDDFPKTSIRYKVLQYDDAVNEIMAGSGLAVPGTIMQRVSKQLESFVRDVRDPLELKDALTKSAKIGGPGLTAAEAEQVLASADKLSKEASFVETLPLTPASESADSSEKPMSGPWTQAAIGVLYAGSADERHRLEERLSALAAASSADEFGPLSASVTTSDLEEGDKFGVLASALALASKGRLFQSLADERVQKAFEKHLSLAGRAESVALLQADPLSPALFEPFLVFLLRDRASLSDNDAARFAIRIGNALKKAKAAGPVINAAFDAETGEFVWGSEGTS